jgi:hypothetical protein
LPDLSNRFPISLLKAEDEYWVGNEGHRRVSIAHALGITLIEAEVTELVQLSPVA